ncbi:MAG TPA: patatin-like phospholipase family protein [Bacteroidia bacterium]|nr:patatin-like phospholipase family protein [Bacteroidia bacterium]HNT80479.1 patatin-like phospholipase family protein [Bacteroidia bacterium]
MRIFSILITIVVLFFSTTQAQKVGLVLSGGGARGLSHVGVIKALEENGIPIHCIVGTSAGALVGGMYAHGFTPDQIAEIMKESGFRQLTQGMLNENLDFYLNKFPANAAIAGINFSVDSTLQAKLPQSIVNSYLIDFLLMENFSGSIALANYDFDSLLVPFRCVASDISNRRMHVFDRGDLAQAIRASIAYPFLFAPVQIGESLFFDGGIYNNYPVDVMKEIFQPDIIIGVNVTSPTEKPLEGDLISQIRFMIIEQQVSEYSDSTLIEIRPQLNSYSSFDFGNSDLFIKQGYLQTQQYIEEIRNRISDVVPLDSISERRKRFYNEQMPVFIDKVYVNGVNNNQKVYLTKMVKPQNIPIDIKLLKKNYFRLISDNLIEKSYPKLIYNKESCFYDLYLDVKINNSIQTEFGGNISSRPVNEGYGSAQFNILQRYLIKNYINFYFGKLYNSFSARSRFQFAGEVPFYVEPYFIINRKDFFRSSSQIFSDEKPPFLLQFDQSIGAALALPPTSNSVLRFDASYALLNNRYYQTRFFSEADTADRTRFEGISAYISFDRNMLNRKMYADKGSRFQLELKQLTGKETTTLGSTAIKSDTIKDKHIWTQIRARYESYFPISRKITTGFNAELLFSSTPFFTNYTATLLVSPSYEPLAEMRTLFLPNYKAHNYTAAGLSGIYKFNANISFRVQAHLFMPFQNILEDDLTKEAKYSEPWSKRYFLGTAGVTYFSPLGPVNLSLNYYDDKQKPLTVLFHFGYILFNRSVLD